MIPSRWSRTAHPALIIAVAGAFEVAAFWPGIMTWDAAREYAQALRGPIDDWHPPAMIWLWRQMLRLAPGPAPMLLVQLGLIFGGHMLLAARMWRERRRGTAACLAACLLFPIALAIEGAVLKDCLMAGAVLVAAVLLYPDEATRRLGRCAAVALLLGEATLRFNAFLACLPWLVAAPPMTWRATRGRRAGITLAAVLALVLAMPIASRLVGATRSHVELSEIIFDLGGITYQSGVDAFPPLPIRDPVAVNARCYRPALWDSYSWWVDRPCPIGFANVGAAFAAGGRGPYVFWLGAILRHPLAYAAHRLRHFAINSRLLPDGAGNRLLPDGPDPNPWGYAPPANPLRRMIDGAAAFLLRTPLGWPIWWMAVACTILLLPCRSWTKRMATSALLYGGGYLMLSVASDLRYHLWTMMAALVAAVMGASDLRAESRPSNLRLTAAAMPIVMVTLLGAVGRLLPI